MVMAGYTSGNWSGLNQGARDFMALKLDATYGVQEAWRWQVGDDSLVHPRIYSSLRHVTMKLKHLLPRLRLFERLQPGVRSEQMLSSEASHSVYSI